jgi:hypothetical protein
MLNKEDQLPCICCQGGDVYSNIICDDCEFDIDFKKELFENMEVLVRQNNDIVGYVPNDISNKLRQEVEKIYNQLNDLKIEGKERCK